MPVAPGALSVTLSQCCRRLVAASFIGIKCHSVVPTAGANSHTEESGFCVLFQFAQSRELDGNTRKAGSPISKTLLYVSAKASAFIGYKFSSFSIHEHPNRCLLLYVAFLVPIRQLPLRAVSHRRDLGLAVEHCRCLLYLPKGLLYPTARFPQQGNPPQQGCRGRLSPRKCHLLLTQPSLSLISMRLYRPSHTAS